MACSPRLPLCGLPPMRPFLNPIGGEGKNKRSSKVSMKVFFRKVLVMGEK